jgi:hypothetical protein
MDSAKEADLQPIHSRQSQHNKTRSVQRNLRRGTDRCRTISCCRSIAFSAARAARLAKNVLKNPKIIRKILISVPPSLVARPKSYDGSLRLARIVSHPESPRTGFSGGTSLKTLLKNLEVCRGNFLVKMP